MLAREDSDRIDWFKKKIKYFVLFAFWLFLGGLFVLLKNKRAAFLETA